MTPKFSIWNARALYHFDPGTRSLKSDYLRPHLRGFHFIAVQETHGDVEDIQDFLHFSNRKYQATFSNFPDSRRTGGVATFFLIPSPSFGYGESSSATGTAL
eukprot:3964617-Pyramimonas_sp.AAC.1